MSTYENVRSTVLSVLEEKNYSKMPATLDSMLVNLRNAEFFAEKSQIARDRYARIEKRITEFCEALNAREMKSASEILRENGLDSETMHKRALIHAGYVYQLAQARAKFIRMEKEFNEKIESSIAKIPFSQRKDFDGLLFQLQDIEIAENETEAVPA